ncbi:MAG: Ppx/GppA phosphatase family protein [Polyangiaceae bacterium]
MNPYAKSGPMAPEPMTPTIMLFPRAALIAPGGPVGAPFSWEFAYAAATTRPKLRPARPWAVVPPIPESGACGSVPRGMPRFAAIDVGSNALRLRIVEATGSSRPSADGAAQLPLLPGERPAPWREIASQRAAVRLGGEVFQSGKLQPASIGQACAALKDFRTAIDAAGVDAYRAVATSAVREAQNGATLVERARREAGIELEVIEGVEEARLIQLAVLRRLDLATRRALLVDVGGGSTELTGLEAGKASFSVSLPLGTVRLLEAYLKDAPVLDKKRARLMREAVERVLAEARGSLTKGAFDVIVGTGGNVETMADLCPPKVKGATSERLVDVESLKATSAKLSALPAPERAKTFGLRPDRADTIVPASAIFLRIAEMLGAGAIIAPGVGLKEGMLEELVDKFFGVLDEAGEADVVMNACLRLGARYQFDRAHGELVAKLALRLFDDLRTVHGLGRRERLLLRAAAMLHDVGDFVRYDGHHKHSYYLILHSDLMGLSPDERAVVANVARYHRKSVPDPSHPNFQELDKGGRATVRALSAILRIADALDREHLGKVQDVRANVERSRCLVTVTGDEERDLEEWTVKAKAGLFRDVFGLDVTLAEREARS